MLRMKDIDIDACLDDLSARLAADFANRPPPVMVGIHTGGDWIAERLHRQLGLTTRRASLNIGFYRDDFSQRGLHPRVGPSAMPEDLDQREVVLVDDVLHTGRTIRAAMNELFDYGRPAAIRLAVLIDRGGRQLPIAADYVGAHLDGLPPDTRIKLLGPDPLRLEQQ